MISSQVQPRGAVQSGMNWWKVTLDSSGAILTCEHVEAVAKGTARVAYVQASTKAEACSNAKLWWEARKLRNKSRLQQRRDTARAAGLCTICCKRPSGRTLKCEPCRERFNARAAELKQGREPRFYQFETPEAAKAAEREVSRRKYEKRKIARPRCQMRYSALWDTLHELGLEGFRNWLAERMAPAERADRGVVFSESEAAE